MARYAYKALDRRTTAEVAGIVEADSLVEAVGKIRATGNLLPLEVRTARTRLGRLFGSLRKELGGIEVTIPGIGGTVKGWQVTEFTRQLSTLQDAGVPLVKSLRILSGMQRPGAFRRILDTVIEDVQSGSMLSAAMARHPQVWDALYTNLVHAGETAGALDTILRRLSEFREKAARLKSKVIGALVYPTAVMTIASGILTFIMVMIVPKFEQIFLEMGIKLPTPTLMLMGFSRFMADWWWVGLLGLVAAIVGLRHARRTAAGGEAIDRLQLVVPVLGKVVKKGAVARFTRTLGTLVGSGVGFLEALDITRRATPNIVVQNAIIMVRESVKEGESVHQPLRRSGIFDDIVVNMVEVGEETGKLDAMLLKIADQYDEEVDRATAAMMSLMEPALIVFMGGAVGAIVIALFMPLIVMITQFGQGQI